MLRATLLTRLLAVTATFAASAFASTASLSTLATFNNTNGKNPDAALIADPSGNLYGTTYSGGATNNGTVFRIDAGTNALTTLATFNQTNGQNPFGVITDATGNLYGATKFGGSNNMGTVFKIASGTNTLSTLASFNGTNGQRPNAGVIADTSGNLYGTTILGGNLLGNVFKLAVGTNTLTALANFNNTNGASPYGSLLADGAGNLYGTTLKGGASNSGTVFKVAAGTNALSTLVTFNGTNGAYPVADLIADSAGNLYGTTQGNGASNLGTVFEIAAGTNTLTTLATFDNTNGASPYGGVILDGAGNLYGTAFVGGSSNAGTVFRVDVATHALSTLWSFSSTDGANPMCDLIADAAGNLYGTTWAGGPSNAGTVFELTNTGFVVPEPGCGSMLCGGLALLLSRRGPRHLRVRLR